MQVGIKLFNFLPGDPNGQEVFAVTVEAPNDTWRTVQQSVYSDMQTVLRGTVVPLTPHMSGDSGIITVRAGDRLLDGEIDDLHGAVSMVLGQHGSLQSTR